MACFCIVSSHSYLKTSLFYILIMSSNTDVKMQPVGGRWETKNYFAGSNFHIIGCFCIAWLGLGLGQGGLGLGGSGLGLGLGWGGLDSNTDQYTQSRWGTMSFLFMFALLYFNIAKMRLIVVTLLIFIFIKYVEWISDIRFSCFNTILLNCYSSVLRVSANCPNAQLLYAVKLCSFFKWPLLLKRA